MRILALEPFFAGSHQAFLSAWQRHSHHDWTLLSLPGRYWKWRMRHAALQFAEQAHQLWRKGARWDAILCSDMLDLAQFRGLTARTLSALPSVAYFHENQLTYPVRTPQTRDLHFAFTNFSTAVAADQVWFNSGFHRQEFLDAFRSWLRKMPDGSFDPHIDHLGQNAIVQSPGIECRERRERRVPGPLRIAWAARWEYDKNPADFFDALQRLKRAGCPFRLMVFGQQFRELPSVFAQAKEALAEQIDHWGFIADRATYFQRLQQADVIVSTAVHEFFGIAIMEGIALGLYPMLPQRLSYPELLQLDDSTAAQRFFFDGSPEHLSQRLAELAHDPSLLNRQAQTELLATAAARYAWPRRAAEMDKALGTIISKERK